MLKMWKIRSFALLLLAAMFVVGCEPQKPQAEAVGLDDAAGNAADKSLGKLDLRILWNRDMPMADNDSVVNFYCFGDTLVLVSEYNGVYAVDASNGNPKWAVRLTEAVETVYQPSRVKISLTPQPVGQGRQDVDVSKDLKNYDAILINSTTRLMLVDNATGNVLRDIPLTFIAAGAAACNGRQAVVMSSFGAVRQIDLLAGVCGFNKIIEQDSSVPMVFYEGLYFIGSQQGKMLCYTVKNNIEKNWEFDVQGPINTPFVVNDMGLFVAGGDKRIYGLSLQKGERLWLPVRIYGSFAGPMAAGENLLFQYAIGSGLSAISMDSGKLAWTKPEGLVVLANFDDRVYLLTNSRKLMVVREADGESLGTASLKPFTKFAVNTAHRGIFAATAEGKIICISPDNVEDLTVGDVAGN
ncbi:MAG TPA: PQQ-binding-like beta-propeller repeat protein [Phycisphaerae bacterium]|nr:PQQ-binding-like beta-propeller repeat protein [Phycisphaerae bacterium]